MTAFVDKYKKGTFKKILHHINFPKKNLKRQKQKCRPKKDLKYV